MDGAVIIPAGVRNRVSLTGRIRVATLSFTLLMRIQGRFQGSNSTHTILRMVQKFPIASVMYESRQYHSAVWTPAAVCHRRTLSSSPCSRLSMFLVSAVEDNTCQSDVAKKQPRQHARKLRVLFAAGGTVRTHFREENRRGVCQTREWIHTIYTTFPP